LTSEHRTAVSRARRGAAPARDPAARRATTRAAIARSLVQLIIGNSGRRRERGDGPDSTETKRKGITRRSGCACRFGYFPHGLSS
jgi:hypothetical protein